MPLYRILLLAICAATPLAAQERTAEDENASSDRLRRARAVEPRLTAVATERLTNRAQVNVKGLSGQLKDWRLTDLKGEDATAKLAPKVDGDRLTIDSNALTQFVIKPRQVETRVIDEAKVMELPGGIVVSDAQSSSEPGETLNWFRLTFLASPLPAIWDPSTELYSTQVTFGLKKPPDARNPQPLEEPVTVRVSFEGLVGDEPPALRIGGPGLENEESFTLRFRPTTENPKLLVRSSISDVDLQLRAVSRLALQAMQSEILGFGLEQATFTVGELLPHGDQASTDQRVPITVSVKGRAKIIPEQPAFGPGIALSQFTVRSSGLGPLSVRAQVGDSVALATVDQQFPFGPLLAVLAGGALGGYARRFMKGARSSRTPRWVAEGLIVGLIAFVAGVLGVGYLSLPAAIVSTEAGAFLTGTICGFAGVAVLEKLTQMLRRPTGAAS